MSVILALTLVGRPAGAQQADRDGRSRQAVLLLHWEHSFAKWYERVSGSGGEAVYALGQDKTRTGKLKWDVVSATVMQTKELEMPLAGQLYIIAEFTMADKAEYDLSRLYSVGGLYPSVLKGEEWEGLSANAGGFHITQRVGQRELPPFRQFSYKGQAGEKATQVVGRGLPVQAGKYRLKIMSAVANEWAAHFPSQAKIDVYFAPDLAAGDEIRVDEQPTTAPDSVARRGCELVIQSVSRPAGGTARVRVMLNGAEKLGDMNVTISYPDKMLQLAGVVKGPMLGNAQFTSNTSRPGQVLLALAEPTGLSGSGCLVSLDFKVIGPAGRKAALTGQVTSASVATDDRKATIGVVGGQVSIEGACGDADGDGQITSRDALLALQLSAKPPEERAADPLLGILDINGDGDITSQDARWLLQLAVGVRPAGYTGPLGQARPDEPAGHDDRPIDVTEAYAQYVTAFDELMDLAGVMEIEKPDELRRAQESLRQAERAYRATKTPQAYAAYSAAHDKLVELLGKVAVESPATLGRAQQRFWAASRRHEQAKGAKGN